jgi:hypothetical protein
MKAKIIFALMSALLLGGTSGAFAQYQKPDQKSVCAFEDAATKKCVVGFVCQHENTQICDVVTKYLQTRELRNIQVTPELRGLNEVCEPDGTFMCTCCSVKAGCYPCPVKKIQ